MNIKSLVVLVCASLALSSCCQWCPPVEVKLPPKVVYVDRVAPPAKASADAADDTVKAIAKLDEATGPMESALNALRIAVMTSDNEKLILAYQTVNDSFSAILDALMVAKVEAAESAEISHSLEALAIKKDNEVESRKVRELALETKVSEYARDLVKVNGKNADLRAFRKYTLWVVGVLVGLVALWIAASRFRLI